ncbi:unnamed protein product, partial [Effrenium voratum]
ASIATEPLLTLDAGRPRGSRFGVAWAFHVSGRKEVSRVKCQLQGFLEILARQATEMPHDGAR